MPAKWQLSGRFSRSRPDRDPAGVAPQETFAVGVGLAQLGGLQTFTGPARATKVAQISRRLAEVGNRGEVRTFEPTSAFGRWPITARDPLVTSGLDRGFDAPVLYNRTPSMTDFGVAVGTIRVNSKPAFANKSRNSGSQRSRPPVVITSIFRSMNLPGSGSSPG